MIQLTRVYASEPGSLRFCPKCITWSLLYCLYEARVSTYLDAADLVDLMLHRVTEQSDDTFRINWLHLISKPEMEITKR